MKFKIIRGDQLKETSYGDTIVTTIFESGFSVAKVRKVGDDVKMGYDTESDVAYYVLEGEGKCVIDGQKYEIKKGDCVFYPKGTPYKHLKGLTLLAIALPKFSRNKRVYIE